MRPGPGGPSVQGAEQALAGMARAPLHGRRALVTGGGRGIGAECARALAAAGVKVCVAARSADQLTEVASVLRAEGHEAWAIPADVSQPDALDGMVRDAHDAMGGIDILVNNAGVAPSNPLHRVSLEEWERVFAVNVTATFLLTKALLPAMVDAGWGRVVNVASTAGLEGGAYIAAYAASKHAVVGFTRAVAAEVSGRGVTVTAVCPGFVDTPLTDTALERIGEKTGMDRAAALRALLAQAGQPRLVRAEEVAEVIVDACADAAGVLNGMCLRMDGSDGG